MAQIDLNTFRFQENSGDSDKPRIGFFFLKNNQDEAIVRFVLDSRDEFDIVASHRINVNGRDRQVSCLRGPKDPLEKCPACDEGLRTQFKLYIKLIEYTRTETGEIVALPKVWERSTAYIDTFLNLLTEYGELSHSVFKIKRNGEAGSKDTRYDIMYLNQANYPESKYPRNTEPFKTYKALGNIVLEKSFEQMQDLLHPQNNNQSNTDAAPAYAEEVKQATQADIFSDFPVTNNPGTPVEKPASETPVRTQPRFTTANNANPFNRPARFY